MRSTALIAILLVSVAGACAKKTEVVEVTPVTVEPTDTGKYK
jgi:hypothetical protein